MGTEKAPSAPPPGIGCTIPPTMDPPPKGKTGRGILFDMRDYVEDAISLYKALTGVALRKVRTPFCPDGSLVHADECTRGELSSMACRVLMKDLWAARLARPDFQKPICDLASKVQCWSRNDDKRLHRLMCYMESSKKQCLIGKVYDKP